MVSSSLVLDPELHNIKTVWDLLSLHLKMCVSLFIVSGLYCRLTKKAKTINKEKQKEKKNNNNNVKTVYARVTIAHKLILFYSFYFIFASSVLWGLYSHSLIHIYIYILIYTYIYIYTVFSWRVKCV